MNEVKKGVPEWDKTSPLYGKSEIFMHMDNITSITEHKTWIEVGLKHHA